MSVKCVCPECHMSIPAPTGAVSVTCPICDTPVSVPGAAVQARAPGRVVAPPKAVAPVRAVAAPRPAIVASARRPARRWWVLCLIATMMLLWLGAAGGALFYYLCPSNADSGADQHPHAGATLSEPVAVVVATQAIIPPPPPPPPPPLPPPLTPEQKRINAAIDRGVTYLKANPADARTGIQALVGLTLLECGVPTDDRQVKGIAQLVREAGPDLNGTYDISLSILFLDRLGDKKDSALIQRLALRLAAGQVGVGGWSYQCPRLSADEEKQFLSFLQTHTGTTKGAPVQVGDFPANLQNCAAIRIADPNAGATGAGSDNSNTQFGVLGLWIALRHKVPVQATLIQAERHFRSSQFPDGHWGYNGDNWPASMTCSGLLGLAIGHSVSARADDRKAPAKDAAIEKGLQLLATHIGPDAPKGGGGGQIIQANAWGDLYYLWSLERVGVVYDLKKIGGKDWYEWASKVLVDAQKPDGSWADTMPGAVDTCFALLVLKRVNVVQDLTVEVKKALNLKDIEGSK